MPRRQLADIPVDRAVELFVETERQKIDHSLVVKLIGDARAEAQTVENV